jgi:exosortase
MDAGSFPVAETTGQTMSITELSPPILAPARHHAAARRITWSAAVAASCIVLAHLPLLAVHAQQIWLRPHYQFFPLVVAGALVLLFARTRRLGPLVPGAAMPVLVFFAAAGSVLLVALLLHSSWLAAVAAILSVAAALVAVGGGRLLWAGTPALILLCVAIPPPFELDRSLILALQGLTARCGSRVLDLLGVYHVLAGHIVETGGRQFFVEEACSGINSLFSVVGGTLFLVFLFRRHPAHAVVLLLAAVVWVLVANVLRVAGVVYLATAQGIDLTAGWRHEAVGYALFAVALLLVFSTDRLLLFLTAPPKGTAVSDPETEAGPTRWAAPLPRLAWPVAAGFATLFVGYVALYGIGDVRAGHEKSATPAVGDLPATILPEHVGSWERSDCDTITRNPGSEFGETSRVWVYRHSSRRATVSLDAAFPTWHDLTRCYTSQGWEIDEETVHGAPDQFSEVRFTKPAYRSGYLLFAEFDAHGTTLAARYGGPRLSLYRHDSALRRLWGEGPSDPPGPILQAQLFVETQMPLDTEGMAEVRALFARVTDDLRRGVADSQATKTKEP